MAIVRGQRNESMFVKSAAVAIWGSEELSKRSVTGQKSNRFGSEARPALTPSKVQYIKDELKRHLEELGKSSDYIQIKTSQVPKYLNEKLHDIRKAGQRSGRSLLGVDGEDEDAVL